MDTADGQGDDLDELMLYSGSNLSKFCGISAY